MTPNSNDTKGSNKSKHIAKSLLENIETKANKELLEKLILEDETSSINQVNKSHIWGLLKNTVVIFSIIIIFVICITFRLIAEIVKTYVSDYQYYGFNPSYIVIGYPEINLINNILAFLILCFIAFIFFKVFKRATTPIKKMGLPF